MNIFDKIKNEEGFRGHIYECSGGNVDFEDKNNRCMSAAVVSRDTGLTIERSDGQSVIFKRL